MGFQNSSSSSSFSIPHSPLGICLYKLLEISNLSSHLYSARLIPALSPIHCTELLEKYSSACVIKSGVLTSKRRLNYKIQLA
jgi:hypothetical protein